MAKSRFEYVKEFERENYLLRDCYIIIRVDGRGFHRFSDHYKFEKPNDDRALAVINDAAEAILKTMPDVMMAYGDSDEYSFLLRKSTQLFERREAKLVSTFASTFTAYYMQRWPVHFDSPLEMAKLPTFDARCVLYPSIESVRDYFSWRQADCHINNLYNTPFWVLVQQGGITPQQAESELCGTNSKDKNELLFSRFGINYNNEPEIYKKGTIFVREMDQKKMKKIAKLHVDIIKDQFWQQRPWLLS